MLSTVTAFGGLALYGIGGLLGLISMLFAHRETIWKALGLWGLGLGSGVAGVLLMFLTLRFQGQERAALIRAGKQVPINDMPGYGQALLTAFGLMFFAATLCAILAIFLVSWVMARRRRAGRADDRSV